MLFTPRLPTLQNAALMPTFTSDFAQAPSLPTDRSHACEDSPIAATVPCAPSPAPSAAMIGPVVVQKVVTQLPIATAAPAT